MDGQISLFDSVLEPGTWVEAHGRRLTFDEIDGRVGQMIVMDMSTESHEWYKVVLVESIYTYDDGSRRLIYYDGGRQRGLVDERRFNAERHPARAYERGD